MKFTAKHQSIAEVLAKGFIFNFGKYDIIDFFTVDEITFNINHLSTQIKHKKLSEIRIDLK